MNRRFSNGIRLLFFVLYLSILYLPGVEAQALKQFKTETENAVDLVKSGKFDEAKTIADQLLPRATSVSDALLLNRLGLVFYDQCRYTEVEPIYKRALEIFEEKQGQDHPNTATLLSNLGLLHHNQNNFAEAEPLFLRALEIREKQFGKDHLNTAGSLNNLASLYSDQNRYKEAEPHYERALKIREIQLDKDHPSIAGSLNNLAELYRKQNRYAEAEPLYRRALEIREKQPDKDAVNLAILLNNLATFCNDQGRYAEAEPFFKRSLEIREARLGKDRLDTAISRNNLGSLCENQGRYKEAELHFKRALEIEEKHYGKDHVGTTIVLNNLAELYKIQGHYPEAEQLHKKILEIRQAKLPENHPHIAISMNNLGLLYDDLGQYEKAELLFKQALKIEERHYGENHLETANALNNLAALYTAAGRYSDAETFYGKSLNIFEQNYGEDHPDAASVLGNLAMLYADQGLYSKADPLYKRVLEIRENVLGADHPSTANTLGNYAELLRTQRRYEEAERLTRRAVKILEEKFGTDHPSTCIYLNNLALHSADRGRYAEAEELYKKIINIHEKIFGKKHPLLANALNNLGGVYYSQEHYFKALPCYKRALDICEELFGDHPDTIVSLNNIALCAYYLGYFEASEKMYERIITIHEKYPMSADSHQTFYSNRSLLYKSIERDDLAIADLKQSMAFSLEVRKQASGSDEQRAQTFEGYYDLFERMIDWQYEFSQKNNDVYDINEAYAAMEFSRGRGLQDLIDAQGIDLLDAIPEDDAEKLRKTQSDAQADVKSFEKQIEILFMRKDMDGNEKTIERSKLETNLSDARKKLVDAEAAIKNASPVYRDILGKDRKPISMKDIREQLEADRCIALEYLIGKEKSYLLAYGFACEPILLPLLVDDVQAVLFDIESGPLSTKKLDTIFRNENNAGLLETISDPKRVPQDGKLDQATCERLAALWTILLPDRKLREYLVNKSGPIKRLLILPDGPLAKFPFEMLVVGVNASGSQFLLDRAPAIFYAPSAAMYRNLTLRPYSDAKSVLTVGDPMYEKVADISAESEQLAIPRGELLSARFGQLKRLKWSANETKWIERSCNDSKPKIPVLRLDRGTATEANVRKNVTGRHIVHLACHGLADDAYGNLFGCLALTPGDRNDPEDDGFLELKEIFGLDLKSCEVAILSACDTNLGPNQQGEGTWSISRGMLVAGARRVVTTDWQVADDAAARLVSEFVKNVNSSKEFDYAAELRSAQLEIRKKRPHPYYWAPFVLVGTH